MRGTFIDFWHDEDGGGTMWALAWFIAFCGLGGLTMDVSNGHRSKAMLQVISDTTALAAVIDLPDSDAAVASAVAYAQLNLPVETYGNTLGLDNVVVGRWDPVAHLIVPGAADPDAVSVTLEQSRAHGNPVPASFLRIMGLMSWDVRTVSVAQKFIPECLKDGLIARGRVDISSNNRFVNEICIHGQTGVSLQSNNYFEAGVGVGMPDLAMLDVPASGMASNDGLQQALMENRLDPRMVNHIDEIMQGMLAYDPEVTPAYVDTSLAVIEIDEKFDLANAEPGRTYDVNCAANKNVQIPSNSVVHDVVIIADCEIKVGSGATVYNAVLGSRSGGNNGQETLKANVGVAANVQLGQPDSCAEGGGVQIFSNATVHIASSAAMDGVQIVAAGDVELGARDQGVNGISVQAGGNIYLTSNNMFGLCSGGAPNLFTVDYFRLVL